MFKLLCALGALGLAAASGDNSTLYRLPRNVLPEHYDLLLLTNVTRGDFKYKGEVTIDLRVVEKTDRVVLHKDKLEIARDKSALHRAGANGGFEAVGIREQHYDADTQFYTLIFAEQLSPDGNYSLTLSFAGEVLDDLFGFYRSSYRANGETRWLGVTQFSSVFARRAFPCMDEPGIKATFQLRIGHYGNETLTSNTFPESRDPTDRADYYITKFSRTPRMSTYLLGWAIHDFKRVNSPDPRIWLWTRLDDVNSLSTRSPALLEGPRIYSTLEQWMTLPNPLGKMEHFAVPDFHFSAMENWGLITFRESVPLILNEMTPLRDVHKNLVSMAHEYAHTWFGNIVTPDFWSIAWLKEGFATYFAYLSIDILHPEWRVMDIFPVEVLQASLLEDSANHTRTMNGRGVGDPRQMLKIADFVTYEKASSIIRMIADVMGEKSFKAAMISFLKENQYGATLPRELYKHLEQATKLNQPTIRLPPGISIGEVIDTWANQSNYPLVRVSLESPTQLLISQEPFKLDRDINDPRSWWIPLRISLNSKGKANQTSTWLGERQARIQLPVEAIDWYLLNPQQVGYYRVDYDASNWRALGEILDSDEFELVPSINRAALIDDAFNLARAGLEDYSLALDLARYLKREEDYEPWVAACSALNLLADKLRDNPNLLSSFKNYARGLLEPVFEKLSFEERATDSRTRKMQRDLILSAACSMSLERCVSSAKSIFDNWIADENKPVPANLKSFVYRQAVVNGTDDDWENLWRRFLATNFQSEKKVMIAALARTSNPSFVERFLQFSVQPVTDVAKQYRLTIVESIVRASSGNIDITLDYVDQHLQEIIELRGSEFVGKIISAIGEEITTSSQINKLTLFKNKNINELGNTLIKSIELAIESAKRNIVWIDRSAAQIASYLDSHTTL